MIKYKTKMSKLMSNIFVRILLCMVLLVIGAMFVKFSSYAKKAEPTETNNQKTQYTSGLDDINKEDSSVIYVDLRKYVISSQENAEDYPENWINDFNDKIIVLQNVFPNNKYWNHMGEEATNPGETNNLYSVTDIPCDHSRYGEMYCNAHYGKSDELYPYKSTCSQCRGFASLLSDLIFGEDAPVRYFENYDELRIGDQARIDGDYHTVFIIDKTDEYVIVAECNSDLQTCQIQWGRKILRKDLSGWYISRWNM